MNRERFTSAAIYALGLGALALQAAKLLGKLFGQRIGFEHNGNYVAPDTSDEKIRLLRPVARPIGARWHGTSGGYNNHGCRCAECTEAFRIAHAKGGYQDRYRDKFRDENGRTLPCTHPGCTRKMALSYGKWGLCKPHFDEQRKILGA